MIATRPSRPATPDWLVQPEMAMCPCGCIGKRRKGSFVEKTLKGGTSLMRQAIFSEDVAAQPGLLQQDGMHPGAKGVDVIVGRILPAVESLIAANPDNS